MRVVIQRVSRASVTIENKIHNSIGDGLMVLLGIENGDTVDDIEWLSSKVCGLRIFGDNNGLMNLSVKDMDGEVLLISQFTLHASTKKGNRPSFLNAARPETAIPLYEKFILTLSRKLEKPVKAGIFGADMKIDLLNDGPVTLIIDSKKRE
ncbi:MAG: D-tyrosyl-tRNA(Tyr) deacylase [Cytophagaceae bacterium]|nr:D-tyrosyl-tRNA(Tyr) deacylase [Cytophagaceae bacterium]|tara:strand:- start:5375 stop:5827 length:453 start_codon:yes stop_codon:yes gene_type:complete